MFGKAFFRASVAIALLLTCELAGCRSSSTVLDVCNARCAREQSCGRKNDVGAANCRAECADQAGLLSDLDNARAKECSNLADIRAAQIDCFAPTASCSSVLIIACMAEAELKCLKK